MASTKSVPSPKIGAPCPKFKQVVFKDNYKFVCIKKKSKLIWDGRSVYSIPDFQTTDVVSQVIVNAPDGDIQYEVAWNGLDVNGLQYPDGTEADILIDGIPSGYQVDVNQSATFYISNEPHQVSLSISGIAVSDLISNEISVDAMDLPIADTPMTSATPVGPPTLPASTDPKLSCVGSGESSGPYPGWSSSSASKFTVITLDNSGDYGVYWCPAANPSGKNPISYTVTASSGGESCETIQTQCEVSGVQGNPTFYLMATDENGSYKSADPLIANSGSTLPCVNFQNYCQSTLAGRTYPLYGNSGPDSIGDCTFAAVANWEHIVLGKNPDPAIIGFEFSSAGGTSASGLSHDRVFSYWKNFGIAGVFLQAQHPYYIDPYDLENALDNPDIGVVIAELQFVKGQNFAGYLPGTGGHWVLVVGYTPMGPLVVTWGATLQMTWQQWNYQATYMWGIAAK